MGQTQQLVIGDAHLHLWDQEKFSYPWLQDRPDLPFALTPADIEQDAVGPTVVIEAGVGAGQELAECEWVRELSQQYTWIQGFVLAVHPDMEDLQRILEQAAADPFIVGVRYNLEGSAAGNINTESNLALITAALRLGLTFDVCIRHYQFPEAYDLLARVRAATEESTLILDHLGKPPIADGNLENWANSLAKFVKLPGVVGKLSGLPAEADPNRGLVEQIAPALRVAMFLFGGDRMMIGSDFPVSRVEGGYGRWRSLVKALVSLGFDDADVEKISLGTMLKIYGLEGQK